MRPAIRLLPLPLCIAFCLSAHAAEDMPEDYGLCPIENAVPVFLDAQDPVGSAGDRTSQQTKVGGESLQGVSGETVNIEGNVSLQRGDQFIGADKLTYDQETEQYVADGNVRYQDSSMRMVAARAEGNQVTDTHEIEDVKYQLTARRGNGGAEAIRMTGAQGALMGSTYSTCPPGARWWELRASRIDVDTDKGFATARNATIRVGRIPVLYMPYFKFPIDDRRQTGLLFPTVALSGRNGLDWRQPIYFNLAPNYDDTLTPRLMTSRGLLLGNEFRYLREKGRGTLYTEILPSDRLTSRDRDEETQEFIDQGYPLENRRKSNRGRFSFKGNEGLSDHWQAIANINWISDPRYLEDLNNNLSTISSYSVNSDLGVYGRGRYWQSSLSAQYRQLADYTFDESRLPYNRLPRAYFSWSQPFGRWLTTGVDAELTRFQHTDTTTKPGGSRIDLKPSISVPLEGASWFITPKLAYRYTAYQLDQDLANQIAGTAGTAETSPNTALPIASLDAGLYFDRSVSFGGEKYVNTLEPRLFYLNAPYRNQDDQPLFDTGALTFSYGQLFRDNRFSGADRQADANQLTLAATTRLIRESDGREKLSASLGQILYFEDSRVGLRRNSSAAKIDQGRSAWIADANYAINDRWSIGTSYQWNPRTNRSDLASVRTRYLLGEEGIVNFNYRYRRAADGQNDLLKQVDFSFLYPVTPSWSLVGRYYYSFLDHKVLETIAGVQWDSCCLAVRLVGRRYVRNRTGDLNSALQLEIELKGLGSAGPDTEGRLRRAILGYYRDDLYLVPPPEARGGGDTSPDPAQ